MKRYFFTIFLFTALMTVGCYQEEPFIRFDHLYRLCEEIEMDGRPCTILHIYADAPRYNWVEAPGEGIACVDDVARGAVLLITAAESGIPIDQKRLYGMLNFLLAMQTPDGKFYNFIHKDFSLNKTGVTSKKSFLFWAARGYWALGRACVYFKSRDPLFAQTLRSAFLQCLTPLDSLLRNYNRYEEKNGRCYPLWLVNHYAGDATSEFLLGLTAFSKIESDTSMDSRIRKLADGVLAMQIWDHEPVNGAFESWPGYWHAWGNAQVQALVEASLSTGEKRYLVAAQKCVDRFYSRLIGCRLFTQYVLADSSTKRYPQIAYDLRNLTLAPLSIYRVTREPKYAILAGIAASWFMGNNEHSSVVYDIGSGRVFDGLDAGGLNRNSGAESTIEGLLALISVKTVPPARHWLDAKRREDADVLDNDTCAGTFITDHKRLDFIWNKPENSFRLKIK